MDDLSNVSVPSGGDVAAPQATLLQAYAPARTAVSDAERLADDLGSFGSSTKSTLESAEASFGAAADPAKQLAANA